MAPPLNIFVLLITLCIHILNFVPALLFPDTLNIYYYFATGQYEALRSFNTLDILLCRHMHRRRGGQRPDKSSEDGDYAETSCKNRCCGRIFCWFKCWWCCPRGCGRRCRRWQASRKKKSHTFLMKSSTLVFQYYFSAFCNFK